MRQKSEALEKFKIFHKLSVVQTKNAMKVLFSDNGTEYVCESFSKYLAEHGIINERSSPYIHEQNGTAEREIRTLVDCARAMLLGANVDRKFWPEAVNTACYILNRVTLQPGDDKTPFEKWYCKKPKIEHMRIFGAVAYMHVPKEKRTKFSAKSKKVLFVGYEQESCNFRLWDPEAQKIFITSNVTFNETALKGEELATEACTLEIDFGIRVEIPDVPAIDELQQPHDARAEVVDPQPPAVNLPAPANGAADDRRNLRNWNERRPPQFYGNPVAHLAEVIQITYDEAISGPDSKHWRAAMEEELQALKTCNTWIPSELPPGRRAVKSRWVFSKKLGPSGEVVRYKARLVAKGYSQQAGVDYNETFAPVV